MISVVIPTRNAEFCLADTLNALQIGIDAGLVSEIIVVDGGSQDNTCAVAEAGGACIIASEQGRGVQLQKGAGLARGDWLLFIHADSVLQPGWVGEARGFIAEQESRLDPGAAVFRFALDDDSIMARLLERLVRLRCRLFALPYGDQGLLIARGMYQAIGGYRPYPLMEDVDIILRIRRNRLTFFNTPMQTSAQKYKTSGYLLRMLRNTFCLSLYFFGVAPNRIAQIYDRPLNQTHMP